MADKGYSSTKKLYYHGLKLHFLGTGCYQSLPQAQYIGFSQALANDLAVVKPVLSQLKACRVIGDKIFACQEFNEQLSRQQVEFLPLLNSKKDKSIYKQPTSCFPAILVQLGNLWRASLLG